MRIKRKPPRGMGAEPREHTENRNKYIAWLKQYIGAFPMSSANDVRRASGNACFDCGVYREFIIILQECGFTPYNGIVVPMKDVNIHNTVRQYGGHIIHGNTKCDGVDYMYISVWDGEDDLDDFIDEVSPSKSVRNMDSGVLTCYFSMPEISK